METVDVERAERIGKRRARVWPALALLFLAQQGSFFTRGHGQRTVDHVKVGAWAVTLLLFLLLLATGGSLVQRRAVRELVEDERTRAHRAAAVAAGFWACMAAGMLLYFLAQFSEVTANEAIHLVLSAGAATALIRFGMLER